ncbi:MAG: peptide-methionine (S)-S-oxide reductase [Candidatus Manganitrophus sp.]|nr:peptide-methionine (S)-S-oxide reductase [Candidatus Manganitrophus sp.]
MPKRCRSSMIPNLIGYDKLLAIFWLNIDPVAINRQFCDFGDQYRSEIFYHGETQKRLAEESKAAIEKSGRFQGADRDEDHRRLRILSGGGLSPGFL